MFRTNQGQKNKWMSHLWSDYPEDNCNIKWKIWGKKSQGPIWFTIKWYYVETFTFQNSSLRLIEGVKIGANRRIFFISTYFVFIFFFLSYPFTSLFFSNHHFFQTSHDDNQVIRNQQEQHKAILVRENDFWGQSDSQQI